ncbi:hypothetical protein [Sorangium sp. So ce341]|uniref:hypothetical protein n=1 Tax=Sorangium sp. So ce341 TaxID=3133302 RepID=UPI003F5D6B9B
MSAEQDRSELEPLLELITPMIQEVCSRLGARGVEKSPLRAHVLGLAIQVFEGYRPASGRSLLDVLLDTLPDEANKYADAHRFPPRGVRAIPASRAPAGPYDPPDLVAQNWALLRHSQLEEDEERLFALLSGPNDELRWRPDEDVARELGWTVERVSAVWRRLEEKVGLR